jgi:hypothetical protein
MRTKDMEFYPVGGREATAIRAGAGSRPFPKVVRRERSCLTAGAMTMGPPSLPLFLAIQRAGRADAGFRRQQAKRRWHFL